MYVQFFDSEYVGGQRRFWWSKTAYATNSPSELRKNVAILMFQDILKSQRAGVGAGPLDTTLATTGAVTHDHYPQKRESRH
jgi:hypothetical protein